MDSAKIMEKLKAMQQKALTVAAKYMLAEVMPFVPIDTGALRRSGKVKNGDNGGVVISFGESGDVSQYVGYQYGKIDGQDSGEYAKQHNFKGNAMARMLELLHGGDKQTSRGKVGKRRYSAAYRQAVEEGTLTRFPNGARWFDIVLFDQEVQKRAWFVYAGAFRGISGSKAAAG